MNSEFNEGHIGQTDPLVELHQEFDWAKVSEGLGEVEGHVRCDSEELEVLGKVLELLLMDAHGAKINLKRIGLNLIALGWVLNPSRFDGSPSVRRLSGQCGVSPATLAHVTGRISRLIGWRNRSQSHAWNWCPGSKTARPKKGGY